MIETTPYTPKSAVQLLDRNKVMIDLNNISFIFLIFYKLGNLNHFGINVLHSMSKHKREE